MHKTSSMLNGVANYRVEELDWQPQSLYLNPTEHQWNELECQHKLGLIPPTSVPNLLSMKLRKSHTIPTSSGRRLEFKRQSKEHMNTLGFGQTALN